MTLFNIVASSTDFDFDDNILANSWQEAVDRFIAMHEGSCGFDIFDIEHVNYARIITNDNHHWHKCFKDDQLVDLSARNRNAAPWNEIIGYLYSKKQA